MKLATSIVLASMVLIGPASLTASGPLGIYGIVEKVVFEPDEKAPERIQVWGAFAYVELRSGQEVSTPRRGYLYFTYPRRAPADVQKNEIVAREWADLKAVAGTGQAIAFGTWQYIGRFEGLQPDTRNDVPPLVLERVPGGNEQTDLRVRLSSEAPAAPAAYQTNAGIVRLAADGSHAAIVKQLKDALDKR
jgi:hypothetical protein